MRIPLLRVSDIVLLAALLVNTLALAHGQDEDDLNLYMMQATVKLQGSNSVGTGFILMRPFKTQILPAGQTSGKLVLITAAHVLEEMQGDQITVILRSRDPQSIESWLRRPYLLPIRANGHPLWTKNGEVDVAAMYVKFDAQLFDKVATIDLLATDDFLQKFQMNPGAQLACLGYPLGAESNPAGFAILRTGVIASYPLLPTAKTKTFLMDFRVFKGNSGGPVYFSQPQFRGGVAFGPRAQFIMGLLSQESLFNVQEQEPYGASLKQLQLFLGVVVHASLIRKTIEMLPPPESPESLQMTVPMRPSQ